MLGDLFRQQIKAALENYRLPGSTDAVELLRMIAAHEADGFKYCQQVRGPALGIYQMEPATFFDVKSYAQRTKWHRVVSPEDKPERMILDFDFATAMARLVFLKRPELLPSSKNLSGMSVYAKRVWNTALGKATPKLYSQAYKKYC